jgi:hypothetical protein
MDIFLVDIGAYKWLLHEWLLVVILSMDIGGY